jgi:hypothetical protein
MHQERTGTITEDAAPVDSAGGFPDHDAITALLSPFALQLQSFHDGMRRMPK